MATITINSGAQGSPGQGTPTGGTTGQFLKKTSNADFDTEWASSGVTVADIGDITNVTITAVGNGETLVYSGGAWINQTLAEAGIAAAVHVHAAGDITSGTFADALVAETNVTQHEAALTITESQISDLGTYLTDAPSNGNEYVRKDGAWAVNSGGAESNDLTSAVTWANIPDANVPESAVTQHQAALSITESQISDLSHFGGAVNDLSDVANTTPADKHVLVYDGVTDNRFENRLLVEADISDLQSYLTAETNDLSAAVTWANVPDANVTESSVTQHQAALSITESQISDLGSYAVVGHSHTESDISDLQSYLLDITGELKRLRSQRTARAVACVGLPTLVQDEGNGGKAENVVDHRGLAEQAFQCGKRRFGPNHAAAALQAFQHGGFLAANVRAGADAHLHGEGAARTGDIRAEIACVEGKVDGAFHGADSMGIF